jgi:8-oxo-dGTP pyrophosphatase MutT (NUDIX family)
MNGRRIVDTILKSIAPDLHLESLKELAGAAEIVHIHLFTKDFKMVLFKRSDGFWMPVAGKVEPNETYLAAAIREMHEETGVLLACDQLMLTDNRFYGLSPNGKIISGRTCWAVLYQPISPSTFKFNGELSEYRVLSLNGALQLLKDKGMPEAIEGFVFLLGEHIGTTELAQDSQKTQ